MVQAHPPGSGVASSRRGRSNPGGPPSAVNVSLAALAGLVVLGVVTGGGRHVVGQLLAFLRFYGGVFTLVALTLTVISGLVATDRIILVARHRVWVQSVHRTLGIVAVSFLCLHVGTELIAGRVGVFGALVPFTTGSFEIGAGTVAAYLMVTVMWTGIVRARFAQQGRPWLWRPLHATAYMAWPVALWHGLNAGRPAAVWVTASYLVLLFLATAALGLRLSAERNLRRQRLAADRVTTEIRPIGRPAPAAYERRAGRFRWDAPPADQMWAEEEARLRAASRGPAVYRGAATVDAAPGPTLRDRFAARRVSVAAAAEEDRYADDDTPTLVNLDSRRELRRQARQEQARERQAREQQARPRRRRDEDDELEYWIQLRGEAR